MNARLRSLRKQHIAAMGSKDVVELRLPASLIHAMQAVGVRSVASLLDKALRDQLKRAITPKATP